MTALVLGAGLLGVCGVAEAGRMPVPGDDLVTIRPFETINYHSEWFRGLEMGTVLVIGDGSTLLRVEVFDEFGNYITSNSGYSASVSFIPHWNQPYTIKVTNLGGLFNRYVLTTN